MPRTDPPNPASAEFGRRVKAMRQALIKRRGRKVSMESISLGIGKDRKFLQRMESGGANPTLRSILLLARALEVDPCELIEDLPDPDALGQVP